MRSSKSNSLLGDGLVRAGRLLLLWIMLIAPLAAWPADDEQLELRSVYTSSNNGIYELHAILVLKVPDGAQQAIRDGAPLNITLEIMVRRTRRFWTDETIATLEQRYEVMYHSVSERYVVRNVNSGAQTSFQTLDAALASLAMINGLPILDTSLVPSEGMNEVSVRANVEVRSIPRALSILLFWVNNWQQSSDWYTWTLKL